MVKEKIIVRSPGRINIIGEHTDYNDGFVLPAAIDKQTIFQLEKESNNVATVTAANVGETFTFNVASFQPIQHGWPNYVMGVVHELQKMGASIGGFTGTFQGDIPIGGGMSSSAALECSLAVGLNELFNLNLDKWQLIKACQMAEHHFVGMKCGIMDQFASIMGKKNQVMFLDCKTLAFQYFPFEIGHYQLLLLNSNVSHTLATSAYNTRRSECEEAVSILQNEYPEIERLRDVSLEQIIEHENKLSDPVFRRCRHVISENQRVKEATQALMDKDLPKLGKLIYQSHFSLQNDYEVSCPELNFLVQQTIQKKYILGSRMMGGGFGGCTLNIIANASVDAFLEEVSISYRERFAIDVTPYTVSIEDGTSIIT